MLSTSLHSCRCHVLRCQCMLFSTMSILQPSARPLQGPLTALAALSNAHTCMSGISTSRDGLPNCATTSRSWTQNLYVSQTTHHHYHQNRPHFATRPSHLLSCCCASSQACDKDSLSVCTQQPCAASKSPQDCEDSDSWAARYNTGLLIRLTPEGIVFSFLF